LPKYEQIKGPTDSSFHTQFLQFVWIFNHKILKIQYISHLTSENCEIIFFKYEFPRSFQQHQEYPQIPIHFSILILFNFHWKNGSIINNIHIVGPNLLKPSCCIPTHQELSKDTNNVAWNAMVQESSTWQNMKQNKTKQNKLPCLIDRYSHFLYLSTTTTTSTNVC